MNNRNIIKKNQYNELRSLQKALDKFFFNDEWMTGWPTLNLGKRWGEFQPQSRFFEDKDNYYIEIDLPGTKKENINIDLLEDNVLRVSGERKERKKVEEANSHYSEVYYGSFTRQFELPSTADKNKENIKARHEDGVLFITVPKSSKNKVQQIKVD